MELLSLWMSPQIHTLCHALTNSVLLCLVWTSFINDPSVVLNILFCSIVFEDRKPSRPDKILKRNNSSKKIGKECFLWLSIYCVGTIATILTSIHLYNDSQRKQLLCSFAVPTKLKRNMWTKIKMWRYK